MALTLSPKHGVNPAIPLCFVCNRDKNQIILMGAAHGAYGDPVNDIKAPRKVVWDMEPCDKCKEHMKLGIIFISVKEGEDGNNLYRTGGWCVMKEEAVRRIITDTEVCDAICKKRMAFIPDEVWEAIELPRGPVEGVPTE